MTKHKKKLGPGKTVVLLLLGLMGLGLTLVLLLQGTDIRLFNPKGLVADEQFRLTMFVVAVMLVIAIPTMFMLYFFAWKYRESNATATYNDHPRQSKLLVASMWGIPTIFMLILASVMWAATHKLEPQKPLTANAKPLTIQVIAMRWKWLFVYPEQNIATVNFVQIPVDTPVRFELTADEAPMNSFWIPHLGGQLYAMTGHTNPLNLIANEAGDYPGSAAEISGRGFAGMKFTARASSSEEFEAWVQQVRQSPEVLDEAGYASLLKPSENNPAAYYAYADQGLYGKVLMKYSGHGGEHSSGGHEAGQH